MQKTLRLAAILGAPLAVALIAQAPVASAHVVSLAACSGDQISANVVRSAGQAGDEQAACSAPVSANPAVLSSPSMLTATQQQRNWQ